MRIASLLPSATEIVYALRLQDSLCAVTSDCDHPAEAKQKPVVSHTALSFDAQARPSEIDRLVRDRVSEGEPIYRVDRALLQELQPELILAQDLCRVCAVPSGHVTEALDVIGCRAEVISLDPHTLDEVIACIARIGRATDTGERAAALIRDLRRRVREVESKVRGRERVRTLALEWADPPFAGGHWVPEMIRLAGGLDVLGVEGTPSKTLSWKDIASSAPDVIVFMPCGFDLDDAVRATSHLYRVEAFRTTPAAARGAVFAVDSSSYFSRPGPRLVDGVETLAWILHPDVFARPPAGRVERVARA